LRVVFVDEVVDEFQLPLQQGKQCGVVVLLGEPCRKGFFAAGKYTARSPFWGLLCGSTGACSRGLLCGVAPAGLLPRASAGG
jgi:hypothetical protein